MNVYKFAFVQMASVSFMAFWLGYDIAAGNGLYLVHLCGLIFMHSVILTMGVLND